MKDNSRNLRVSGRVIKTSMDFHATNDTSNNHQEGNELSPRPLARRDLAVLVTAVERRRTVLNREGNFSDKDSDRRPDATVTTRDDGLCRECDAPSSLVPLGMPAVGNSARFSGAIL
ncbi:hypothetical protein HAX54_046886 [Datura stramonium]|uniref:Uncharacterized protein n=1 Tax=Datura stramonium TaxID=4076 RepID=A0ABS8WLC3_DATST|nr:hypothetical protein [Datura stramonium]